MSIDEIHSDLIAKLTALPAVAAFAPFFIEDNVTDFEEQILTALDSSGAAILVSDISGGFQDEAAHDLRAFVSVPFAIFVFENPNIIHTPAGLSLLKAIKQAVCVYGKTQYSFKGFQKETGKHGATQTVMEFSVRAEI